MIETPEEVGRYKISIAVSAAFIFLLLAIILIVVFYYFPSLRETLVFSTAVVGGFAGLYAGFYSVRLQTITLRRDILTRSIEVINRVTNADHATVRSYAFKDFYSDKIPPAEIHDYILNDKNLFHASVTALNHFEEISITIQKGYVDEELIYMALASQVHVLYGNLEPFIKGQRTKIDRPSLLIELEKLAKSWDSGKYLFSGKPITPNS